jgi:hypothetical protein
MDLAAHKISQKINKTKERERAKKKIKKNQMAFMPPQILHFTLMCVSVCMSVDEVH